MKVVFIDDVRYQEGANGKLADVEVHFLSGPFAGLKLIGFGIWRQSTGKLNVTMPARQYAINGERRSFALLRPTDASGLATCARDYILDAYARRNAMPEPQDNVAPSVGFDRPI